MADERLSGLGILIVEDETLLRKQLSTQFERLGADVTGAADLTTTNSQRLCRVRQW